MGQIRLGFILAGSLVVGLSGPRSLAGVSLSAVGLAGRVELSWQATDDDYSGFILERSLTPESGFVPIHSGILEPVVTRHEDDSVPAGQTCFYRVLAVNDTGTETSNPAAAAAFDNLPPTISHLPVESWEPGQSIELEAAVTDSLQVKTVEWHYRRPGEADYTTMPMLPDGKGPRGPWSVRLNRIPVTADTLIAQDFAEHTATVEPSISPAPYGTQAGPWDLRGYGGTTVAYGLITNGVFTTGTNWVQYEDRNWVVVYVGKQLQESPGRIRARVSWQKADEGTAVGTFVIGLGRRGRYWWSDCVHIRWNQMTDEIQSLYVDEFTTDGGAMQNLGSAAFPGVPLGQISELDVWHIDDTLCLAVNGVERLRITHSKIRTQWGPDVFWELFSWSRPGWWAAVHGVGFYREPPPGGRYLTGTDAPVAVAPGLEYYISASDGVNVSRIGTPDAPLRIQVDDAPVLTSITPAETTGEEPRTVLLNGRRFADGAVVTFDGRTALETVWRGATQVECRVPPHFPARVDVRLTNPDSQSASLPGGFTYRGTPGTLSLPELITEVGAEFEVAIQASGLRGLRAAGFEIGFESADLAFLGIAEIPVGMICEAGEPAPGVAAVSLALKDESPDDLGTLIRLRFRAIGPPGYSVDLSWMKAVLNDGLIPAATTNGSVTIVESPAPDPITIVTGSIRQDAGTGLGFEIRGPAGRTVIVEASSDLRSWTERESLPLQDGVAQFDDPAPAVDGICFYRVRQAPD